MVGDSPKPNTIPGGVKTDWLDIQIVLSRLEKYKKRGNEYNGLCPAHDDRKFSLSMKVGRDSRILLHCFAGCSYQEILSALNLQHSDVCPPKKPKARIVKTYPYTDAAVNVIYEKVRFEPKDFRQRRFDHAGRSVWFLSAGWSEYKNWGEKSGFYKVKLDEQTYAEDPNKKPHADAVWFDECPRFVYGLLKLQSLPPGSMVFSFEGEKGADRADEVFSSTSVAVGGARSWRSQFAESLRGFDLVIFPDNDAPGRELAREQAEACLNIAARVRIVELPGLQPKQDIYDWIEAGGTLEQLQELIDAAPDYRHERVAEDGPIDEVEVIGDDPPISSDQQRERYLRQLARNTSKVMDAVVQIFNKLNFQEDHTRLLNTLTICARDRLGTVAINHAWLASKYPGGGMSKSTVARDVAKLVDEQEVIGVELLGYKHGTKNPNLEHGYASKFTLHFLRYALQAINLAIDIKGDFDYSFQALDVACDEIVSQIPHFEPKKSAMVEKKERAEARAETASGQAIRERARVRIRCEMDRFYQDMLNAAFSLEEAVEDLNDEYNDATERAAQESESVEEARPPVAPADYRDTKDITNTKNMTVGKV